jgi:protein-tyrosine phosphatase
MKRILAAIAFMAPLIACAQLTDSVKRLVPVKGAVNFRDVGGYKTINGTQVVWGKIYRSAAINRLTDADVTLLDKKGIHTVVDFRGVSESTAAPDRLPKNTDYTLCPAGSDSLPSAAQMTALLKSDHGDFLLDFYGQAAVQYSGDRFRPLFVKLLTLDDNESLMYHCTGGRDRTGMATALLLYTLQVPMETIEADYVASNVYLKSFNKQTLAGLSKMSGLTEAQVGEKMSLKPEYLRVFFSSLKEEYGSIENFLQSEMGVGPREVTLLRTKYTK